MSHVIDKYIFPLKTISLSKHLPLPSNTIHHQHLNPPALTLRLQLSLTIHALLTLLSRRIAEFPVCDHERYQNIINSNKY